jgi:hypothetical protein
MVSSNSTIWVGHRSASGLTDASRMKESFLQVEAKAGPLLEYF